MPSFKNPFAKIFKKKKQAQPATDPNQMEFGSNAQMNGALGGAANLAQGVDGGILAGMDAPKLDKIKSKDVSAKTKLGGGSAHEVTKLTTKQEIGNSGSTTGFFKKDPKKESAESAQAAGIGQKKGDSHMAARSVASSRLDSELGIGVLSDERFGKIGGKKGVVSAEAEGSQFAKSSWSEISKTDYDEAYAPMGPDWAKEENGRYYKFDGSTVADGIDLSRPETQKGFSDLAVMDYLTGQVDRHMGNVFVDPISGKVTGIDNDMAFGTENYDEKHGKNGLSSMPDLIDAGTADKLLDMDIDTFIETLKGKDGDYGHLSDEEIAEARNRFTMMQAKMQIMKMSGGLVEEWDDDTFEQSNEKRGDLTDLDQGNDYLSRAINFQNAAAGTH